MADIIFNSSVSLSGDGTMGRFVIRIYGPLVDPSRRSIETHQGEKQEISVTRSFPSIYLERLSALSIYFDA